MTDRYALTEKGANYVALCGPVRHNLRGLRQLHSHLFRMDQVWFDREAFMEVCLPEGERKAVADVGTAIGPDTHGYILVDGAGFLCDSLPLAVELCDAYIRDPFNPIWHRYLWCRDTDDEGQRVYIGVNDGLMEIHRHLHLTERWGVASWT